MSGQLNSVYTSTFFDGVADGTRESAQTVVPLVNELLRPTSVLDVGCATGTWLAEWAKVGVSDVIGIDGDYVKRAELQMPVDKFVPRDLERPFSLDRKFDLVQTLEVAEHLSAASADTFVESLTKHGDTILFSAAIPGQGGEHHVNEQWPSYWAEKFAKAGYAAYDIIRPKIWKDPRVVSFYKQNMLVFARGRVFESTGTCLDLVHPEMWDRGQPYLHTLRRASGAVVRVLTGKREDYRHTAEARRGR